MSISHVGEFGLIEQLRRLCPAGASVVGIGDDAAVLDIPGDSYMLATVDMLVDGVHFRLSHIPPEDLGQRLLAVSVSDIAAMGGAPTFALVSLALPLDIGLPLVTSLYDGLCGAAEPLGVGVVGGNVTRTPGPLSLDLALLGTVRKTDVVLRRGARPGDILAVTGRLGLAAAVRLLTETGMSAEAERDRLGPLARLKAGQVLAASHLARAMMDISDGLAGDAHRLCAASEVGLHILERHVPVDPLARGASETLGREPAELALHGGEDYELLIALDPSQVGRARTLVEPLPLTVVGTVMPREYGVMIERVNGRVDPLPDDGWKHF